MAFLVAEIGVNWDGDLLLLEHMMKDAKHAGFNAVKFQAFLPETVKNHPESKRLIKSSVSENNIEDINNLSKKIGIEWFATPMYKEAVDLLNPFVKRFKIREIDGRNILNGNQSEIFKAIDKTDKLIIISSQKSPKNSKYYTESKISWLYCVPKYPCPIEELDFSNLQDFNGYSNHCVYFVAPLTATILGAGIIEVHITSDREKNYIDNIVSFDYNQYSNLIKQIHLAEKIKKSNHI